MEHKHRSRSRVGERTCGEASGAAEDAGEVDHLEAVVEIGLRLANAQLA